MKRVLIGLAVLCEGAAAIGFGELHFGSVTVALVALGLALYFIAQFEQS